MTDPKNHTPELTRALLEIYNSGTDEGARDTAREALIKVVGHERFCFTEALAIGCSSLDAADANAAIRFALDHMDVLEGFEQFMPELVELVAEDDESDESE